jgi:hypothetical protein
MVFVDFRLDRELFSSTMRRMIALEVNSRGKLTRDYPRLLPDSEIHTFAGRSIVSAQAPDEGHFDIVTKALKKGWLIPFLGAGVNLCDRPPNYDSSQPWRPESGLLPSGAELSRYLAGEFHYQGADPSNLLRVTQFITCMGGERYVDDELQKILDQDYPLTPVHEFFATVPRRLRELKCPTPNLLIVTTNYDDLMERALRSAGESYDVVRYIQNGKHAGCFWHQSSDGTVSCVIEKPNEYLGVDLGQRSVVLKVHGAVQRSLRSDNGEGVQHDFVITEDDYIDFLTRGDVASHIPAVLAEKFSQSQFLFLGYGLADWNMRVFFKGVQNTQRKQFSRLKSWAVQLNPDDLEQRFWKDRDVEIFDQRLDDYVRQLALHLSSK